MSEKRETLIFYKSPGTNGASADIRIAGTGEELLRAFVKIALSLEGHLHLNRTKLVTVLPLLMELEKSGTTVISADLEAIRKAKEGGAHE